MELRMVRGGELAVDDPGGEGVPFVWAHGLTSPMAHEDAAGLLPWSTLPAVRTIRYDARGHGRSPSRPDPTPHRWEELALDLLALLDEFGLERTAAGGASMGCATCLHAVRLAPERFDRLVLVVPPTAWATRAAQADLYRAGADVVERNGPSALAALIRSQPPTATFGPDAERLRELRASTIEEMDPAILPWVLRGAAASDLPDPAELAGFERPVLVLTWEGDPIHPVETAERLADALARAELHVAPDLDAIRRWPELVGRFVTAIG